VWHCLARLGAPVEAVAAEIDQPPAGPEMIGERLHHALGMIFRMLPRDDHAIRCEQRGTLLVQVVIGDHVGLDAEAVQEMDDVAVGADASGA
jgi:hypothetical protein